MVAVKDDDEDVAVVPPVPCVGPPLLFIVSDLALPLRYICEALSTERLDDWLPIDVVSEGSVVLSPAVRLVPGDRVTPENKSDSTAEAFPFHFANHRNTSSAAVG